MHAASESHHISSGSCLNLRSVMARVVRGPGRTWQVQATLVSEWPFSQAAGPAVVAHRGDSAHAPENTIEAFESAIGAGAEVVEFDVRMTADGVAVVMHDADVDRTTDGSGPVRSLS